MKKISLYTGLRLALTVWSCSESELPDYNGPRYVQFKNASDIVTTRTFIYDAPGVEFHTVYVQVDLMGNLSTEPLKFTLEQIEHKEWLYRYDDFGQVVDSVAKEIMQAKPGIHYIAPDPADMVIEPGTRSTLLGLVLRRDATLEADPHYLRLRIVPGEGLTAGVLTRLENLFVVSDKLERPSNWSEILFGKYSRVKHRLMIDLSGLPWDDAVVAEVSRDLSVQAYYSRLVNAALAAYAQENGTPMEDENQEVITFPSL